MIVFIQSPPNPINNETEGNLGRLLNMGSKSHKDISIQQQGIINKTQHHYLIFRKGGYYLKKDMNPL